MQTLNFNNANIQKIADSILSGEVCVIPTDTLYGFSCSAFSKHAVEKIYKLKQREADKPFIILLPNIQALSRFGIVLDTQTEKKLQDLWPAKLSVVFDCANSEYEYLHRGKKTLCFRIPAYPLLLSLLELTGPITSTTVNISGENPIEDINEAKGIFGDDVNLYVDAGILKSEPSTVIKISDGNITVIRQGSLIIS